MECGSGEEVDTDGMERQKGELRWNAKR